MRLAVGDKVIYPSQGPCLICPLVQKVVDGNTVSFYHLALLDGSGGELFVPVEKAQNIGLRPLLQRVEVPELLGRLKRTMGAVGNWKQRNLENFRRLSSGSAFDLAEVVESLTELSGSKTLSFRERWMLDKARMLLVREISEVMQESVSAAEEQLDRALEARNEECDWTQRH